MDAYGIPRNPDTESPDCADGKLYGFAFVGWRKGSTKQRARRIWKKRERTHAKLNIRAALLDEFYAEQA